MKTRRHFADNLGALAVELGQRTNARACRILRASSLAVHGELAEPTVDDETLNG